MTQTLRILCLVSLGWTVAPPALAQDASLVAEIDQALERKAPQRAQADLDRIRGTVGDSADDLAALGDAYLVIDRPTPAARAYDDALAIDADHVLAIVGRARVYERRGQHREARRSLENAGARLDDPRIDVARAAFYGRTGRWQRGRDLLTTLGQDSESSPVAERLARKHLPAASIDTRLVTNSGESGTNRLNAAMVDIGMRDLSYRWLRLSADARVVTLTNGIDQEQGVSASVGLASPASFPFRVGAKLGMSPTGFRLPGFLTYQLHAGGTIGSSLDLMVAMGRDPVTDTLLSWAGSLDEDGQAFGQASDLWQSVGARIATPSRFELGLHLRASLIEALGADTISRQTLIGRVGQTLDGGVGYGRLGLDVSHQNNSAQLDAFALVGAGVFSPLTHTVGLAHLSGGLTPGSRGFMVCGGAAVGVQTLTGTGNLYFTPGTFAAADLDFGIRVPVASELFVEGQARMWTVGNLWSHRNLGVSIRYVPFWRPSHLDDRRPPPMAIHGTPWAPRRRCLDQM